MWALWKPWKICNCELWEQKNEKNPSWKICSVKSIEENFHRQGKDMYMQTSGIQEHQREKDRKATSPLPCSQAIPQNHRAVLTITKERGPCLSCIAARCIPCLEAWSSPRQEQGTRIHRTHFVSCGRTVPQYYLSVPLTSLLFFFFCKNHSWSFPVVSHFSLVGAHGWILRRPLSS